VRGVPEVLRSAASALVPVPTSAAVAATVSDPLRKVRRFMAFDSMGGSLV
jgi:hypothetical protein